MAPLKNNAGAWVNLKNDAVQDISHSGIKDCFEQGNELLGKYDSRLASVHDPDEYLGYGPPLT